VILAFFPLTLRSVFIRKSQGQHRDSIRLGSLGFDQRPARQAGLADHGQDASVALISPGFV
jgi:hypothetical protein